MKELLELSKQITLLGKNLNKIKDKIKVPDIPLLNIKAGKYDVQRFIYWNFLKCFWNHELGFNNSIAANFDWYSPSIAHKYSRKEFIELAQNENLKKNIY